MKTLHIKNMVCDRCKKVLTDQLESRSIKVHTVELGKLIIDIPAEVEFSTVEKIINANGFEIIPDEETLLVEKIKNLLISFIQDLPIIRNKKLSVLISEELSMDYHKLSKLFSRHENITIEKYYLKLKIEKVRELIQLGEYSFTEIADLLDYSNSNHLARQFKSETGMSMSEYKNLNINDRKPLDKII